MLFQPFYYLAHERLPWKISWKRPNRRINNTSAPLAKEVSELTDRSAGIIGNKRINSTSNTKKITAIKKKRIENGRRDINLGENPHSKGLNFSRSNEDFNPKPLPNPNKAKANKIVVV